MVVEMRLLIYGGRDWLKRKRSYAFIDDFAARNRVTRVVSGMASGADRIGYRWGVDNKIKILKFYPKWDDLSAKPCVVKIDRYGDKYNALAGFNRNELMAKAADAAIEFPGGAGTADMRKRLLKHGVEPIIFTE